MASSRKVAVAIILSFPSPSPSTTTTSTPAAPASSSLPEPTFLLVSSRKKKHLYVFPKGGVESGESPAEAAEREAWEEAGLTIGSATHLTHLLTLSDPSSHILSPTDDPLSASFVASCEYSFELFVLPPAPASTSPPCTAGTSSSSADILSSLPSAPPPVPSASLSSSTTTTPCSPSSPSLIHPSNLHPPHPALPPIWPESTERHRALLPSWFALETAVCWGRREEVMRQAVRAAKEWVEEDLAHGQGKGGLIRQALKGGES
ncbi:hypothetical protein JCM11251_007387 [Rhodosporidiobolus azoricus]